jgi:peroxiredoxin Q/BCP
LLADTDKAVHRAYGVLGLMDLPRRSVFVVDAGGTIRYAHRALVGVTYRPVRELMDAITALR